MSEKEGGLSPLVLVVGPVETNCYLMPTEQGTLIVDPGDEAERIAAAMDALPPPAAVLLTHGHPDHAGAAAALAARLEVPVFAHEGDRDWVEGRLNVWGWSTPRVECRWVSEDVPLLPRVRVLATPGHSPGSVCYQVGGLWFVGDTVFCGSVGRTDLPGGDGEALMASLARLGEVVAPEAELLPGHGPQTTLAQELVHNPWMQEALGD